MAALLSTHPCILRKNQCEANFEKLILEGVSLVR